MNEVLEHEIPQLQEIAGKTRKKEEELKGLKSELAALDRKIQLELAPPAQEVPVKENDRQQIEPIVNIEKINPSSIENMPQRSLANERSPIGNFIADHVIIGHPGARIKEENRTKKIKL